MNAWPVMWLISDIDVAEAPTHRPAHGGAVGRWLRNPWLDPLSYSLSDPRRQLCDPSLFLHLESWWMIQFQVLSGTFKHAAALVWSLGLGR
jgi:hypothetical protein